MRLSKEWRMLQESGVSGSKLKIKREDEDQMIKRWSLEDDKPVVSLDDIQEVLNTESNPKDFFIFFN